MNAPRRRASWGTSRPALTRSVPRGSGSVPRPPALHSPPGPLIGGQHLDATRRALPLSEGPCPRCQHRCCTLHALLPRSCARSPAQEAIRPPPERSGVCTQGAVPANDPVTDLAFADTASARASKLALSEAGTCAALPEGRAEEAGAGSHPAHDHPDQGVRDGPSPEEKSAGQDLAHRVEPQQEYKT